MTDAQNRQPIRVLVVDDHPMILEGTQALLRRSPNIEVVGAATSGKEAVQMVEELQPEVLLLDVRLPDMNGVEVAHAVRTTFPDVAVLVLTGYDDTGMLRSMLQLGVPGYLRKTATGDELIAAVEAVAAGQKVLEAELLQIGLASVEQSFTEREISVLRLAATGMRNAEIADQLEVSVKTVEFHMRHVLAKLGVRSRTEATGTAVQRGIISLDDEGNVI
ncbi:MAG: response regulator [Chloroflexaceae bacterium]